MLQAIRDRAQGFFAWVMLILIGVPFALWGIQNYFDSGKEQPVAVVGDRDFYERDVQRVYEQSLANLVGIADFDEKQIKQEALEKLIREEILAQNAEEKHLVVSDVDVREFIQTLPYFQTEGKFDKEKYKITLSSQGMNPGEFAMQVKRALVMEQFQRGLTDSAFVTSKQVESFLRLKNQERNIAYLTIPLKKSDQNYTAAEIEDFYHKNLSSFQNPERVIIEYIALSLDELARQVQASDEDLRHLYEEQKSNFTTEERRRVSHILITIDGEGQEAEKAALSKANEIREALLKGKDFASLAKENSKDPGSAQKGGDLGLMSKGDMEQNFANAAFSLEPGALSEPVKTAFGFHLIKLVEVQASKTKTFDDVKQELLTTFQHNAAENKFYELGQKLTELTYEHPDSLELAAKELNLKIETTDWFTRDSGAGIAQETEIREATFKEDVLNGRNSDPVELGNEKAIVLRVKEHQPASAKPLDSVKEEILGKLRTEQAKAEARKLGEDLLKQAREGKALSSIAKEQKGLITQTATLKRDSTHLSPVIVSAVFGKSLGPEGKPIFDRIELEGGDQVIYSLLAVKAGAPASDQTKEEELARGLLHRAAGQQELSSLIAQLRQISDVYIKPGT
jgi:peptidyl-prolyl cis-trans isomerase D